MVKKNFAPEPPGSSYRGPIFRPLFIAKSIFCPAGHILHLRDDFLNQINILQRYHWDIHCKIEDKFAFSSEIGEFLIPPWKFQTDVPPVKILLKFEYSPSRDRSLVWHDKIFGYSTDWSDIHNIRLVLL